MKLANYSDILHECTPSWGVRFFRPRRLLDATINITANGDFKTKPERQIGERANIFVIKVHENCNCSWWIYLCRNVHATAQGRARTRNWKKNFLICGGTARRHNGAMKSSTATFFEHINSDCGVIANKRWLFGIGELLLDMSFKVNWQLTTRKLNLERLVNGFVFRRVGFCHSLKRKQKDIWRLNKCKKSQHKPIFLRAKNPH